MMTKRKFLAYFAVVILSLVQIGPVPAASLMSAKASGPMDVLTIPLYRFQAKNGSGIYAAYPAYVKLFDNASVTWDKFGVVGHVYPEKKAGTVPLLALHHKSNVGIASFYFYTTDIDEAIAKQNADWDAEQIHKGVIGYVATKPQPGTIAVYRYRQPTAQASYIYAFGEQENKALKKNADLKFEKIAFYVWANAVEPEKEPKSSDFPTGPGETTPAGSFDLSMREALYYNGASKAKVNTASQYVTAGETMTLKKSQALKCAGDTCTFNLGFIIYRNNGNGKLSGYAQLSGPKINIVGNSFTFQPGQKIKDFILPAQLKTGENKIKVAVDPYQKAAETNKKNNSFEVTIIVEP